MAAADSPVWRRAFDDIERRVGRPLESATSSSEFQSAALKLRHVKRAVVGPVHTLAGWGLHLAGLPSNADVRELRRQLGEVQRELMALHRHLVATDRDQQEPR